MGNSLPGKLVLIIAGSMLIGLALSYHSKRRKIVKGGIRTTAVVTDYCAGPSDQYFYIYGYTLQGRKYTGTGDVGVERISRKKIGKSVTIVCSKDDPRKFVTAQDPAMAAAMSILTIAGIGLIAIGLFLV